MAQSKSIHTPAKVIHEDRMGTNVTMKYPRPLPSQVRESRNDVGGARNKDPKVNFQSITKPLFNMINKSLVDKVDTCIR